MKSDILKKLGVTATVFAFVFAFSVAASAATADVSKEVRLDGDDSSAKIEAQFDHEVMDAEFAVKHIAKGIFGFDAEKLAMAEIDVDEDGSKAELKFSKEMDNAKFDLEITADAEEGTIAVSVNKEGSEEMIKKFLMKVHENKMKMHAAHMEGMEEAPVTAEEAEM